VTNITDTSWTSKRREILDEHERMHATILAIESELDDMLERPAQPGEAWQLARLVKELRDQFKRHFESEEQDGLLGAGADHYDFETMRDIGRLIVDHRKFQGAVERIIDELDCNFVPGKTVQSCFDGELRKLISRFAVHEAAEKALLDKLLTKVMRHDARSR
jgi:hypothetical protein